MGSSGPTPGITKEDVRSVFSRAADPHTPLSTAEVADRLDCTPETVVNALEALAEHGEVATRRLDDQRAVWWRLSDENGDSRPTELQEFGEFVRAVEDYAIFMLDPDGTVASWNDGAERIKGYAEDEIVGEHFSTFYTAEDISESVPERNLEAARNRGRVEDKGWRLREDGSRFWADVVITAIRDGDGDLQGFTKVTRDMTEQREYEQQIQEERDLVEQIFETVPVSIYTVNSDGEFVRANRRALDRIKTDRSDIEGFSIDSWEIYDADGEPIPKADWPWTQVKETGEPVFDYQCQSDLPGLGRRWLSINTAPIQNSPHEEDQFVVSVDDITEQKERERQIRRERDQTEQLLRTAPIAIAVQDTEGNTILANQRAQDALGISEQEFIEEPDNVDEWTIYDEDGEPIPPAEMPSARVLATEEPVLDEEIRIDPPDGNPMYFHINAAPVFRPDGTIERVITAGEDISELKKREQQLEQRKIELETELGEVLGRISDAFYALNTEWEFTHLNDQAAEIFDRSADELLGQSLWAAFPELREGPIWENLRAAMETQESVNFERYVEEIGMWLEITVYPSESGVSVYFQDITERKEYERKLEESNERLEQFAYAASHDLQEPLRMVSSYLQLIENRYTDDLDEDAREFIEFAVGGAERMRDMVEGLLEYSRVETQGDTFEPVDLDAVLADVRNDLQLQIDESDTEISAESLPVVEGDEDQLRQVLQNLVDNAIEYSGDSPPQVTIAADRTAERWQITVQDEGIGIDPDDTDRIFQVFQRLHSQEEHAGTGIGLSLCRRIVERHGGEIGVESEPDEGATFRFTLPASSESPE